MIWRASTCSIGSLGLSGLSVEVSSGEPFQRLMDVYREGRAVAA